MRVPWTARRSNQSIRKEINPEYSLEDLMLKLKLQYFGHLIQRAYWLRKTLMLGKTEGKRRRGQQRMRWLDSITDSLDMNFSRFWEIVEDRGAWHAAVHGFIVRHDIVTEQQFFHSFRLYCQTLESDNFVMTEIEHIFMNSRLLNLFSCLPSTNIFAS